MKKMIFLPMFLFITTNLIIAQSESDIKNMVESKQFVFVAQFALPVGGRSVSLNSDYDLTVSGDSVIAYLPYYGVAYSAPINPDKGGINFTSSRSEYVSRKAKKDGWDISIKPKDVPDPQELTLHVSSNGRSTLQVTSINRQAITFTGYIKENKKPKRGF